MRLVAALLVAMVSGANALQAQQTPFDMAPERPPAETIVPDLPEEAPAEPAPTQPAAEFHRLLLPAGSLTLPGENAARSWALHLTAAQAASPARLHLAYRNAVVVAPEGSRLQVRLNEVTVLDIPVRSADGLTDIVAELPENLMRAGRNEVAVRVRHRHRTDCTIESTYELWTEIDAARTYLSFSDPAAGALSSFEDMRAIGADAQGRARISIVAPAMAHGDIRADIMRLVQAVALYMGLPNLEFTIDAAPSPTDHDATLRVLVGSGEELTELGWNLSTGGPVAAFLPPGAAQGPPTLMVSGRSREDWLVALDQMLMPVDRPAATRREALTTEAWRMPNAPMIYGRRDLSFAELGIRSEQFSGRRYATGFQFAVAADFYADSYGEARILLDAAYSDAVLPGSQINVYVNGTVAASMPIASQRGAILNRLPVKLTMRHFKPGLNDVVIEANLLTEQDAVCLPGATADDWPRFAIFDTSRFAVPDFARIGQRPNLTAMAGTGYPYNLVERPVSIVVERGDAGSLSAAADLLARMALSAGRSIPVSFTVSADTARGQDAIFLGAINGIPAGVLAQVGVADESRTSWPASHGRAPTGSGADQTNAEAWRRQMEGSDWLSEIGDWLSRTFDLTLDMLRFAPAAESAFTPSRPAMLLVAQETNPAGNGVWTLVAAPDGAMLREGTGALAEQSNWNRLSGNMATLESDLETVNAMPVASSSFIQTQPPSLSNYRLIAANWLSANILSYSLLLVAACVFLAIATSALLSRLGRKR